MTTLQSAILKTLVYGDIFDYPLTEQELWRFLIGKTTKLSLFRRALGDLESKKKIIYQRGYWVLPKRQRLIPLRQKRHKIALQKLKIANRVAWILAKIPTVWLVGVSGALALHNTPDDDDIDLFIITAPNTLWTTRLVVTLALDLLNLRRKPGETKFKDKICLNMFIDTSRLALPKKERDLYGAHEVAQLMPLINKNHIYEQFLKANVWVRSFLPHAFISPRQTQKPQKMDLERLLLVPEKLSKQIQLWYMKKRRTTESLGTTMLRFHPVDARDWVNSRYAQKLKNLR